MPFTRLGVRTEVGGVRKPPGDETAGRCGLGGGAERLWGFEGHALWDVLSAGRSSGMDGGKSVLGSVVRPRLRIGRCCRVAVSVSNEGLWARAVVAGEDPAAKSSIARW